MTTFERFANDLVDIYGVQYDKEEQFVCCPECGEPLHSCDWDPQDYIIKEKGHFVSYICPVCEAEL